MKKDTNLFRFVLVWTTVILSISCSSDGKKEDSLVDVLLEPVVFTAIGDVPYGEWQRDSILNVIAAHNIRANSEFVIHLGDIKTGQTACTDAAYKDASDILKMFQVPTFIVLGDNEYNDCINPDEAFALWNSYFFKFNTNWTFTPTIAYQPERPENFSWIQRKVLFLGINIVGSSVHDAQEWETRLTDDANWVKQHLETEKEKINAVVVFGHANITEGDPTKFKPFTDVFRNAAATFGKPILYLQGDGHLWFTNKPWPEKNITRVQIDGGHRAVEVTVDPNKKNPFSYNRTFLD
ncbi:metallophosphoesterase [Cellulophaga sp. F20128]|uniref:metallophosphoesterase n=1 Tax=Cellulophaga sp. F20128 TaxID=2926413 RepID=UPI001FF14B1A|nr:metallophosphoesterase [Cellulophaga sp. F20128]MCK0156991.1 metallophosphoesterase [Cellulophaga sp. F20128]